MMSCHYQSKNQLTSYKGPKHKSIFSFRPHKTSLHHQSALQPSEDRIIASRESFFLPHCIFGILAVLLKREQNHSLWKFSPSIYRSNTSSTSKWTSFTPPSSFLSSVFSARASESPSPRVLLRFWSPSHFTSLLWWKPNFYAQTPSPILTFSHAHSPHFPHFPTNPSLLLYFWHFPRLGLCFSLSHPFPALIPRNSIPLHSLTPIPTPQNFPKNLEIP